MAKKKKESYPHFRRYKFEEGGKNKKAKHPKLIIERKDDTFGFLGLTKSHKRGHHSNLPLLKNPQKGNANPAYLRDDLRYESTKRFEEILTDYRLSREDKKRVLAYIEYLKAKKKR